MVAGKLHSSGQGVKRVYWRVVFGIAYVACVKILIVV